MSVLHLMLNSLCEGGVGTGPYGNFSKWMKVLGRTVTVYPK